MIINVKDLTEDLTILSEKILIFKKVMSNTENFIQELNSIDHNYSLDKSETVDPGSNYPISEWVDWAANDDSAEIYGKQKTGIFNFSEVYKDASRGHKQGVSLVNQVKQCADDLAKEYFKHLYIEDTPYLPNVFDIKIYQPGALMGRHYDLHPFAGNKTILSAVIYLNDDYEGGELYFDQQDIKIIPEAGCVIFFPSTDDFTHASLEIVSGQKECIPLFFYENPED
jgi:hypothetical protein